MVGAELLWRLNRRSAVCQPLSIEFQLNLTDFFSFRSSAFCPAPVALHWIIFDDRRDARQSSRDVWGIELWRDFQISARGVFKFFRLSRLAFRNFFYSDFNKVSTLIARAPPAQAYTIRLRNFLASSISCVWFLKVKKKMCLTEWRKLLYLLERKHRNLPRRRGVSEVFEESSKNFSIFHEDFTAIET